MAQDHAQTPEDFAARLEHYARLVIEIRGVSRTNPHQFVEDKSELAGAMRDEARRLRTPRPRERRP